MTSEFFLSDFRCRPAGKVDIEAVARTHLLAFPGYFLSTLGAGFLALMYRAFLETSRSVFLVCEDHNGSVVGFAVGVPAGQNQDFRIAIKFLPAMSIAAFSALIRHPVTVGSGLIVRLLKRNSPAEIHSSAYWLRSIGVAPVHHGTGVAPKLLAAFEVAAVGQGATQIVLTTDEVDNDRTRRFYEREGYSVLRRFFQGGSRPMLLLSKSAKDVESQQLAP